MKHTLAHPKPKKISVKAMKKKAWDVFSKYIRLKEVMPNGNTPCFTCGFAYPWKSMQAGHWLSGHHNSVMFDERNVHSQCIRCNIFLHGNLVEYTYEMQRLYSPVILEELKTRNHNATPMKAYEYKELYEEYTEKLQGMDTREQLKNKY